MSMESMAFWLAGSVLFTLGIIVVITGIIIINNLLHKFWKPITVIIVRNDAAYPKMRYSSEKEIIGTKEPSFSEDFDKIKK